VSGDDRQQPDHTLRPVEGPDGQRPEITAYVKPEMELYVAQEVYKRAPPEQGKTAKRSCSCDLVCTCEQVAACGCNIVKVRQPVGVTLACVCDTVPACHCNVVTACACDRVRTMVCTCESVCVCVAKCTCEAVRRCACQQVTTLCPCQRHCGTACGCVGHSSGSVCVCVPVIH